MPRAGVGAAHERARHARDCASKPKTAFGEAVRGASEQERERLHTSPARAHGGMQTSAPRVSVLQTAKMLVRATRATLFQSTVRRPACRAGAHGRRPSAEYRSLALSCHARARRTAFSRCGGNRCQASPRKCVSLHAAPRAAWKFQIILNHVCYFHASAHALSASYTPIYAEHAFTQTCLTWDGAFRAVPFLFHRRACRFAQASFTQASLTTRSAFERQLRCI